MKRVFIAINLSENIKIILREILDDLKERYRGAPIRFVKPNGFHITLHFLGNQNDAKIREIAKILNEICAKHEKIQLSLGKFGFFPDNFQPRVVWIAGEDDGSHRVESLQKNLGQELEKAGLKIDKRAWHPHITLGRISGKIRTSILKNMKVPPARWETDSLELMESKLESEGAEYQILHSAKFGN